MQEHPVSSAQIETAFPVNNCLSPSRIPMNASAYSRPLNFFWALGLPLAVMILLLSVEPTRLDFALADAFYDPGTGFIGRHSALLEDILHDRAKQLVILIGIIAIF